MGTDGCEQDTWDGGVRERPTGGKRIGGAACRGGENAAVCLDNGEELGIAVDLKIGDVGGGTAIDDEFVENFELFALDGVFRVDDAFGGSGRSAEDGASEAHAKVDAHTLLSHDTVQVGFVGRELEVCEEAEGPKGEG